MPLIQPSTRDLFSEGRRTKGYSWFDFVHGYAYARWPYLYIGIGTQEHPSSAWVVPLVNGIARLFGAFSGGEPHAKGMAETYHGKVVTTEAAKQLVRVQEPIALPNLEHIIPFQHARDIVITNPDHIAVLECPCRASRPNPCLPLDVCLIVGEPFAGFIIDHHPEKARWITQQEAVEILEAERDRGHVHHAFFKDAMLNRFYAICNCCSCCCGAMQAARNGTPMLISSGYVSHVDQDLCIQCGLCEEVCPFDALALGTASPEINQEACMGCGLYVAACAQGALTLQRDDSKGAPLEIAALLAMQEA